MVSDMTHHLPNSYPAPRARSPARQNDAELQHMLAAIGKDWKRELTNISLGSVWSHVERAVIALNSSDPRKRSDAGDALLDAVLKIVETTSARLQACDAWERDHPG
jgi:hypothetical protein